MRAGTSNDAAAYPPLARCRAAQTLTWGGALRLCDGAERAITFSFVEPRDLDAAGAPAASVALLVR